MRSFILIILLIVSACGKNTVEKTDEAIDIALTHLSARECDDALEVLQDLGMQADNGVYLQVLASAYACKAGFDEITFVANDLQNMVTTSGQTIFKSLATMSLSAETEADSLEYSAIKTGLNIILDSTSASPAQADRNAKFGSRKGGDMGVQALILGLVNFGKFLRYYGNADSTGVKGTLPGSDCFINYNDPRAQLVIAGGSSGACNANNEGHPDLDQTTADGKRRMCEGLVLLTNTLDVLNNIDFSNSSTLSKFDTVKSKVNDFKSAAAAAGLGSIMDMTSQDDCEAFVAVPAQLLDLEYFYALTFELGLI